MLPDTHLLLHRPRSAEPRRCAVESGPAPAAVRAFAEAGPA